MALRARPVRHYAAAVTDQPFRSSPAGGVGEEPEPWEPADWAAVLRRRRLSVAGGAAALVAGVAALVVLLSVLHSAPPTIAAWVLVAVAVVLALAILAPLLTAGRRARWEERQRWAVLADHALAAHVSIGADARDAVSERARTRISLAGAAVVGYPLLLLLVAFLLWNDGDLPGLAVLAGVLIAVVLCGWALVASRRRAAEARRWLADPRPPEPPRRRP